MFGVTPQATNNLTRWWAAALHRSSTNHHRPEDLTFRASPPQRRPGVRTPLASTNDQMNRRASPPADSHHHGQFHNRETYQLSRTPPWDLDAYLHAHAICRERGHPIADRWRQPEPAKRAAEHLRPLRYAQSVQCQRRALHQQCGLPGREYQRHRAAQPYTKVFSGEQNYSWNRGNTSSVRLAVLAEILDTLPDAPEQSILSYASNATAINPSTGTASAPRRYRRQRRQFLPGHRRFVRSSAAAAEFQHEGQGHRRVHSGQLEDPS